MIDIKLIRENPEMVKENIRKKFQDEKLVLVDEVLALLDVLVLAWLELDEDELVWPALVELSLLEVLFSSLLSSVASVVFPSSSSDGRVVVTTVSASSIC